MRSAAVIQVQTVLQQSTSTTVKMHINKGKVLDRIWMNLCLKWSSKYVYEYLTELSQNKAYWSFNKLSIFKGRPMYFFDDMVFRCRPYPSRFSVI